MWRSTFSCSESLLFQGNISLKTTSVWHPYSPSSIFPFFIWAKTCRRSLSGRSFPDFSSVILGGDFTVNINCCDELQSTDETRKKTFLHYKYAAPLKITPRAIWRVWLWSLLPVDEKMKFRVGCYKPCFTGRAAQRRLNMDLDYTWESGTNKISALNSVSSVSATVSYI